MRDYTSRKAWSEYRAEKKKGFPYSGTAAMKLNDGYKGSKDMRDRQTSGASAFFPYWAALELIKEGEKDVLKKDISEILETCKKNRANDIEYYKNFEPCYDRYHGYPIKWEYFRPYDERFNEPGYGTETEICTLPFRATKAEKEELKESLWIHFRNPYCDGRDCTGARFTNSISIYTTAEKTVILRENGYDI